VILGRPPCGRERQRQPVETETGAVPADDGLRLHDDQEVGPAGPEAAESEPEEPVQPIQRGTGTLPFENRDLLPEGENFEGVIGSAAEEHTDGSQGREYEFGHELTLVAWRNVVRAGQAAPNCTPLSRRC